MSISAALVSWEIRMNGQLSLSGVPYRSVPGCHPSQDFCNATAAGFARSQMALTIASTVAREIRQAYAQLLSMGNNALWF